MSAVTLSVIIDSFSMYNTYSTGYFDHLYDFEYCGSLWRTFWLDCNIRRVVETIGLV